MGQPSILPPHPPNQQIALILPGMPAVAQQPPSIAFVFLVDVLAGRKKHPGTTQSETCWFDFPALPA